MTEVGEFESIVSFSVEGDDPSKWYAVTSFNRVVPITKLLDHEGDEVSDIDDAFALVAGCDDRWFSIAIGDWVARSNN